MSLVPRILLVSGALLCLRFGLTSPSLGSDLLPLPTERIGGLALPESVPPPRIQLGTGSSFLVRTTERGRVLQSFDGRFRWLDASRQWGGTRVRLEFRQSRVRGATEVGRDQSKGYGSEDRLAATVERGPVAVSLIREVGRIKVDSDLFEGLSGLIPNPDLSVTARDVALGLAYSASLGKQVTAKVGVSAGRSVATGRFQESGQSPVLTVPLDQSILGSRIELEAGNWSLKTQFANGEGTDRLSLNGASAGRAKTTTDRSDLALGWRSQDPAGSWSASAGWSRSGIGVRGWLNNSADLALQTPLDGRVDFSLSGRTHIWSLLATRESQYRNGGGAVVEFGLVRIRASSRSRYDLRLFANGIGEESQTRPAPLDLIRLGYRHRQPLGQGRAEFGIEQWVPLPQKSGRGPASGGGGGSRRTFGGLTLWTSYSW